ncbi:hypothetical protein K6T82_06900 [Flavobacterium sp. 17A]|uniref:Uncharacterized protein n=1 Tax=Flavobacterium potami TaxID=2872310 RepID=A0A9X1H995_9FLAO|nr:hypothetical protein [Flavobacterium potami]MBZ4034487.1 hypothetical protein [Flavobacterium potami]
MKKSIENEIENQTTQLLELVNLKCWNTISKNLVFILSNISEVKGDDFFTQQLNRNKINANKTPKSFKEAIADLKEIYDLIHDINLYVYKSEKDRTIIDIRYFLKSKLDPDYLKTVIDNPPMLHSKITLPHLKEEKFDVNWEHQ